MPEYTYEDRKTIEAEAEMWAVVEILKAISHEGAWAKRIKELADTAVEIARELRNYNDQFEVE